MLPVAGCIRSSGSGHLLDTSKGGVKEGWLPDDVPLTLNCGLWIKDSPTVD
ncbi:MAG: hypothetical protein AB1861_00470 [Cyanobacteriota bacterium]